MVYALTIMLLFSGIIITVASAYAQSQSTQENVIILLPNYPPNKPQKPSGPTGGGIIFNRVLVGNEYDYSSVTTDPDGDQVSYKWDWGDGNISEWSAFEPSGEGVSATYIWMRAGTFEVRVKAKDTSEAESDWSDPLEVTVVKKLSASGIPDGDLELQSESQEFEGQSSESFEQEQLTSEEQSSEEFTNN